MIALLLLTLSTVSSAEPVYLNRDDNAHHWHPVKRDVAMMEAVLHVPEHMGGPVGNFDRYYTGIFRGGHRIMFVELLRPSWRPGGRKVQVVRPDKVPGIGDGGCGVIHLSYDMVTGEYSSLECNFNGPGPPPPPPHS